MRKKNVTTRNLNRYFCLRIAVSALLFLSISLNIQAQPHKKVKWMKFTEAIEASKKEPRKIFVDIYASWCGWCKVLDNTTFADSAIVKILNTEYYPVKIDSESKEALKFKGYDLTYAELAVILGADRGSNLGLPTMVFLNEDHDLLTRVPGYQKAEAMKPILLYFSENHYKNQQWDEYHRQYTEKQNTKKK
ncbi:MAG: DUF255 domain-containing protein [Prevotellaceae bacterium]|jgi:thioredoxin-related protein|nr:DUF255 domain-containing protein [Prevotellaceae bacterium]